MGRKKQKPSNYISTAINPLQGTGLQNPTSALQGAVSTNVNVTRNLTNYIAPVQLERLKYDVRMWRDAVREMEFAYYPQRIKVQRMFRDTILNLHIAACVKKRKRLTTLRDFEMVVGDTEYKDITKAFKKKWFYNLQSYSIDAVLYGYSLISLGDLIDNIIRDVKLIQRWNVSPDRFNVTSYIYATSGKCFLDDDVKDWHIYIDTPSEDGQSPCGYGLFYPVALCEIILRNNLGFNTDFVERFSMPYVHGKTTKTDEGERGVFEDTLKNMGANGYAVTDPMDEIAFLEAALAGTGWNGYDNLEQRLEKKCTKILLGHADAMDSTPGKLGGNQDAEFSPVQVALSEVQAEDGRLIEQVVNDQLIPKLRNLGINLPEGIEFRFKNNDEKQEIKKREDESNQATATIAKTLSEAGLQMDTAYFTERTGIPVEVKEVTEPLEDNVTGLPAKIKNKLKALYS